MIHGWQLQIRVRIMGMWGSEARPPGSKHGSQVKRTDLTVIIDIGGTSRTLTPREYGC